jgi:hypothetical protein
MSIHDSPEPLESQSPLKGAGFLMRFCRIGQGIAGGKGVKKRSTLVFKQHFLGCSRVDFEIIGDIRDIEVIAIGTGIRDRARLQKQYGRAKWRKLKGVAQVQLPNGMIRVAEIHWYEAHGIGKKEFKLKLPFLD